MEDKLKRASWLELFYDVAYVALIAQFTYTIADNHTNLQDWLLIAIVGYSIFLSWWATTANRNLLPTESKSDKLIIQLQMLGAFLMSLSMPSLFEGLHAPFFLSLGFVKLVQISSMLKMYYLFPDTRPNTYNILQGFSVATGLWLVSAFVAAPVFLVTAGMALVLEIFTPQTKGKGNIMRYLNVHHLQERLGLFLMLVIGESMIVVALANSASIFNMAHPTIVFSGLGLMVALWWLYFEHSEKHVGQRPNNLFLFLHAHGFLYGSIVLVSVAYKLIIMGSEAAASMTFLLMGSFGICLSLLVIRSTLHTVCSRSIVMVGAFIGISIIAGVIGWSYGFVYETAIFITVLFSIAAKLDHHSLFGGKNYK